MAHTFSSVILFALKCAVSCLYSTNYKQRSVSRARVFVFSHTTQRRRTNQCATKSCAGKAFRGGKSVFARLSAEKSFCHSDEKFFIRSGRQINRNLMNDAQFAWLICCRWANFQHSLSTDCGPFKNLPIRENAHLVIESFFTAELAKLKITQLSWARRRQPQTLVVKLVREKQGCFVVIGWPRESQTVSQYAANWQRDHLGDEFRFNYSPIGVERTSNGADCSPQLQTERETATSAARARERNDLSLLPNIRTVSAEG